MNLFEKQQRGLTYANFIAQYASAAHKDRWRQAHAQVELTASQKNLLGSFTRRMPVLALAGAWCGDCINQCPIFEHFAAAAQVTQDWLNEFERVQWLLRLSPRLRQKHGD